MAIVRQLVSDALIEISAIGIGDTMSASDAQLGLRWFQRQLDAWQADRLTMALQRRVIFTMPAGYSSVTIGATDADVAIGQRPPTSLDTVNYFNPGSSPGQEVQIGMMDRDTFANLSIKTLPSRLPIAGFYQNTSIRTTGQSLLTNGAFEGDVDGWQAGANWTYTDRAVLHTAGSTDTLAQNPLGNGSIHLGSSYTVTFTIASRTAGNLDGTTSILGGVPLNTGGTFATNETFSVTVTPTTTAGLILTPSSAFDGSISEVAVELVPSTDNVGELFLWPQVTQDVQIAIYFLASPGVPATLDDVLIGPAGYEEAWVYQLAVRLVTPFSKAMPPALPALATEALARIKRPNVDPGVLGVDQALVPYTGLGYNVFSDTYTGWGGNR